MCKILCVTNRHLVKDDFWGQLEKIAAAKVDGIILREKDLEEKAYQTLAEDAGRICKRYQVPLFLHTHWRLAKEMGIRKIHLPYPICSAMPESERAWFSVLGVSIHSVEEAKAARQMGASYVTAGHIFATDCKRGVVPRGLIFLDQVCRETDLFVYAIGGIDSSNVKSCIQTGAAGVCLMSSLMQAEEPDRYIKSLKQRGATAS